MVLRLAMVMTVLLLAGCGGDDEESASTTAGTTAAASSCVAATSDLMAPVGGRVALENPEVRLQNGQLVESTESPGIWFLAAELDGPDLEEPGDVGTWATTSQFGGEAIYAVNELATKYTNFSDVAEADGISADDPAAGEAAGCVGE